MERPPRALGLQVTKDEVRRSSGINSLVGRQLFPPQLAAHMNKSIVNAIEGTERVERVLHMRTQHLGPEELLVAAKVEFDERLDSENLTEVIDHVEANVRAVAPIARMIYIEPDFHDPDHTDLDGGA